LPSQVWTAAPSVHNSHRTAKRSFLNPLHDSFYFFLFSEKKNKQIVFKIQKLIIINMKWLLGETESDEKQSDENR
jgi:hypothetical protein